MTVDSLLFVSKRASVAAAALLCLAAAQLVAAVSSPTAPSPGEVRVAIGP